jgi:hypothetical protein
MNKILCILLIIILLLLSCILLLKIFKKTKTLFSGGNTTLKSIASQELIVHYVSPCGYKLFTLNLHTLFSNIPIYTNDDLNEAFNDIVNKIINDNYTDNIKRNKKDYNKLIKKYTENFNEEDTINIYQILQKYCTENKLEQFTELKREEIINSKDKIEDIEQFKEYVDYSYRNILFEFFRDCFNHVLPELKLDNSKQFNKNVDNMLETYIKFFEKNKYLKNTVDKITEQLTENKNTKQLTKNKNIKQYGNGITYDFNYDDPTYINLKEDNIYYLMLKICTFGVEDEKTKKETYYICVLYSILNENEYNPKENKSFKATPKYINCNDLYDLYYSNGIKYKTNPHSATISYGDLYYKPITYEPIGEEKHNYHGWIPIKLKYTNYKKCIKCFVVQEIVQGKHLSKNENGESFTYETNSIPKTALKYVDTLVLKD